MKKTIAMLAMGALLIGSAMAQQGGKSSTTATTGTSSMSTSSSSKPMKHDMKKSGKMKGSSTAPSASNS